jgi:hypothetical protein
MDHFAGLDVSVKDASVCIVDEAGKIVSMQPRIGRPILTKGIALRFTIRLFVRTIGTRLWVHRKV